MQIKPKYKKTLESQEVKVNLTLNLVTHTFSTLKICAKYFIYFTFNILIYITFFS